MDPFSIQYISAIGMTFTVGGVGAYLFTGDTVALWLAGTGLFLFFIAALGAYALICKYRKAVKEHYPYRDYMIYEYYNSKVKSLDELSKFNHNDFN